MSGELIVLYIRSELFPYKVIIMVKYGLTIVIAIAIIKKINITVLYYLLNQNKGCKPTGSMKSL